MPTSWVRQPLFTYVITVLGLLVAFIVAFLCFMFVRTEMSFDRAIPRHTETFRLNLTINSPGGEPVQLPSVTATTARSLLESVPQVETVTRISREEVLLELNGRRTREPAYVVDQNFLEFFGAGLRFGDAASALSLPGTAVLSEEFARRVFGQSDAVGATFHVGQNVVRVSGILDAWSETSHLRPELLLSSASGFTKLGAADDGASPGDFIAYTYVRSRPGQSDDVIEQVRELPRIMPIMPAPQAEALNPQVELIAVADIHLDGLPAGELSAGGSKTLVIAIAAVGLLMLGVTCLNYSILVTANAERRIQEIGVRKAFGATPTQILRGFAFPTVSTAITAGLLSAILLWLGLPTINEQLGSQLHFAWPTDAVAVIGFPILVAAVALVALAASSSSAVNAQPVVALRGELKRRGALWRMVAAASQFAISIVLVAMTIIIADQVSLAVDRSLNIGNDEILIVDGLQEPFPPTSRQTLADTLSQVPGVVSVGLSQIVPTNFSTSTVGLMNAASGQTAPMGFSANSVDAGFFATFGLSPIAGELFRHGSESGGANEIVLTLSSLSGLGFPSPESAVGRTVAMAGPGGTMVPFTVRGVVPDIVLKSIEGSAEQIVFTKLANRGRFLSVRFEPSNMSEVRAALDRHWAQVSTEPLSAFTLRDRLTELYEPLDRSFRLFFGLAAAALITAGLGIYGTASFTAERRTKEMGLRKALGASALDVASELFISLAKPLLAGAILAIPLSLAIGTWWLSGFAQRIALTPLPFAAALMVAVLVGILSVGTQTFKLARTNPAIALRRDL